MSLFGLAGDGKGVLLLDTPLCVLTQRGAGGFFGFFSLRLILADQRQF